jgi:hypothetical protein
MRSVETIRMVRGAHARQGMVVLIGLGRLNLNQSGQQ